MGWIPVANACICSWRIIKLFRPFCRSCSFKCCGGWRYLQGGSFLWHLPFMESKQQVTLPFWTSTCGGGCANLHSVSERVHLFRVYSRHTSKVSHLESLTCGFKGGGMTGLTMAIILTLFSSQIKGMFSLIAMKVSNCCVFVQQFPNRMASAFEVMWSVDVSLTRPALVYNQLWKTRISTVNAILFHWWVL